jgi:cyclophilin family peptidyl-prolyl cis-trans isomerase
MKNTLMMIVMLTLFVSEGCTQNKKTDQNKNESNSTTEKVGKMNKTPQKGNGYVVVLETSLGSIEIELNKEKAPITVENFLNYVTSGAYDGTVFHRVKDGFMIQGGGFTIDGKKKSTNPPIKLESNNGLLNEVGTIAMARTNIPDSATNQFFINVKDNSFLNYSSTNTDSLYLAHSSPGYAVFGKVVKGMDIVNNIKRVKTTVRNGMKDWPVDDVLIKKVFLKK